MDILVASSSGAFSGKQGDAIEEAGYTAIRDRPFESHAELKIIKWAQENLRPDQKLQAIGVSHKDGICPHCHINMLRRGITPASPFFQEYSKKPPKMYPSNDWIDSGWGWIGGQP